MSRGEVVFIGGIDWFFFDEIFGCRSYWGGEAIPCWIFVVLVRASDHTPNIPARSFSGYGCCLAVECCILVWYLMMMSSKCFSCNGCVLQWMRGVLNETVLMLDQQQRAT